MDIDGIGRGDVLVSATLKHYSKRFPLQVLFYRFFSTDTDSTLFLKLFAPHRAPLVAGIQCRSTDVR